MYDPIQASFEALDGLQVEWAQAARRHELQFFLIHSEPPLSPEESAALLYHLSDLSGERIVDTESYGHQQAVTTSALAGSRKALRRFCTLAERTIEAMSCMPAEWQIEPWPQHRLIGARAAHDWARHVAALGIRSGSQYPDLKPVHGPLIIPPELDGPEKEAMTRLLGVRKVEATAMRNMFSASPQAISVLIDLWMHAHEIEPTPDGDEAWEDHHQHSIGEAGGLDEPGLKQGKPAGAKLPKKALALATLVQHPDWTDKMIAEHAGCNVKSLYRWPEFKNARAIQRQRRDDMPTGRKDESGNLDAWDEEG